MILGENGTDSNSTDSNGTINKKLGENDTFTTLGLKIWGLV